MSSVRGSRRGRFRPTRSWVTTRIAVVASAFGSHIQELRDGERLADGEIVVCSGAPQLNRRGHGQDSTPVRVRLVFDTEPSAGSEKQYQSRRHAFMAWGLKYGKLMEDWALRPDGREECAFLVKSPLVPGMRSGKWGVHCVFCG